MLLNLEPPLPPPTLPSTSPEVAALQQYGIMAIDFELPPRSNRPALTSTEEPAGFRNLGADMHLPPVPETFTTTATCFHPLNDRPRSNRASVVPSAGSSSLVHLDSMYVTRERLTFQTDCGSLKDMMDQVDPHVNGGKTLTRLHAAPGTRPPPKMNLSWTDDTPDGQMGFPIFNGQAVIGRQGPDGRTTWHVAKTEYRPYSKPVTRPQATDMFHFARAKEISQGRVASYAVMIPESEAVRAAEQMKNTRRGGNGGLMSCASELTRRG
ncbi:hypothetical protein IAT38_007635 [Cryptococcus sp. DSM 104549]